MSEKHRALPLWMKKKKEEKVKKKEPLKRRRKRKTERSVFYCMNERELVEAAVSSCLTGGGWMEDLLTHQQVEDKVAVKMRDDPAAPETTAKPVPLEDESTDCGSDALDTTYVSETDLDTTEMETVPYAESPPAQIPGGQRSGPVRDRGGLVNVGLEAEEKEETEAAEEDDALRLVREIFFT